MTDPLFRKIDCHSLRVPDLDAALRPMEAAQFARKVLRQLSQNKAIIVVPSWWKAIWWLDRASPTLSIFLARKVFESAIRELTETLGAGRQAG